MITKQDIIVNFSGTIAEAKTLIEYIDPERIYKAKEVLYEDIVEQRRDLIDTFAKELLKFLGEDQ